ncbi:uncharacterized protein LOC119576928 isoform X2 [Penaeus monodon]|uniref:uncharacterized protein LOC119576928 isoform X2 n=1 Tax=Penaeus monodon TaxID=6687 RepID=UPI0018A70E12|nr:uncharacterized protein LOC119576928 isoform X2 [Penaeus monodon]
MKEPIKFVHMFSVMLKRKAKLSIVILSFVLYFCNRSLLPSSKISFSTSRSPLAGSAWDPGELSNEEDQCRALFKISGVYRAKNNQSYDTRSSENVPAWYTGSEFVKMARRRVRTFLEDISRRPEGPSTQDYRTLGSVLPRLLYYRQEKAESSPLASRLTKSDEILPVSRMKRPLAIQKDTEKIFVMDRFQTTDGDLPFVPCRVKRYTRTDINACFKKRLEKKNQFSMFFLGDSKIRNMVIEFLNMTSYFDYTVFRKNESWPWTVYRTMLEDEHIRFSDFEATTASHPGLRFIFKFRRFWEWRDMDASDEVKILTEWAEGTQPVPDLLVAGYTSWMLYTIPQRLQNDPNFPLDVLDLLMRVHEVVVPLLQKVADRTRVLVHADPRLRPHSQAKKPRHRLAMNAVFQDFLEDWSEMMFRFFEKFGRSRIVKRRRLVTRTMPLGGGLEHKVHVVKEITNGDRPYAGFDDARLRAEASASRDYLIPDSNGLWWWDTSLPLNMATIAECTELHKLNLTQLPQYSDPVLRCEDHHHSGTATLNFEVHMLLNLICNTHLAVDPHICCS